MRKAVLAAAFLMSGALASPAAADMNAAFGNTIISYYPDGAWVKHWFDRDGSYRAVFSDGRRLTARWALEGERICLNGIRPRMLLSRFCTPMVEASVGETWPSRDPLGRRVRNELIAGR